MNLYSNVTEFEDFTCYFDSYNVIDSLKKNNKNEEFVHRLNVLFCYSDSIQFVFSLYNRSGHAYGDYELKGSKARERRLLNYFKNNFKLDEKCYIKGISEPFTEEELKKVRKKK